MNARERLQRIAKEANDKGHVLACSDNDAAALRELDQLCEDMARYIFNMRHGIEGATLLERAAQAGYGEK